MTAWLQNLVDAGVPQQDWLAPQRAHALELLKHRQWPTRKTEDWRYLPVELWARADLTSVNGGDTPVSESIDGLDAFELRFADGALQGDLPSGLPSGVTVSTLSQGELAAPWASEQFAGIKPERHLFGLINDLLATSGVIIDVADGVQLSQPLRLVHLASAGSQSHLRVLVRVGKAARLSLVEEFRGDDLSQTTAFTECVVCEEAQLEHYRFAFQSGESQSVGGCHFALMDSAELVSNLVGYGSALSRLDVDVCHRGSHAKAKVNAIYLLDGKETFDLHSTIEHEVPNGTTEENVRGIVADNSRAIFNGRIHIHRDAQKTLAELNNRNLLLSDRAEINTKPELEIYADDVRCAHGATIAEIDRKAMYYLQSRGIDKKQAQVMLNFGFLNELVEDMPNAAIVEWLKPQLSQRFAEMSIK